MLKTFVGYIDLKDVIHQIEENKKKEMKKRLHHQNFDCICEDYVFYTEKIKNVLFEYCNDVFIENDNDLYFDMTHSQLLFDGDMNEVMKSIAFQIDSEYHIHINIAMSFHQDFAKWIYHHCQDQYRMLDYHQAQRIFGKNLCQKRGKKLSPRQSETNGRVDCAPQRIPRSRRLFCGPRRTKKRRQADQGSCKPALLYYDSDYYESV